MFEVGQQLMVEWLDACHVRDAVEITDGLLCRTAGFVCQQSDSCLHVAQEEMRAKGAFNSFRDITSIPLVLIRRVWFVKGKRIIEQDYAERQGPQMVQTRFGPAISVGPDQVVMSNPKEDGK
jgi:hypothetical protein